MTRTAISQKMLKYIDAGFPVLYLEMSEEIKADMLISAVAKSSSRDPVEWNAAGGVADWKNTADKLLKIPRSFSRDAVNLELALDILKDPEELENKLLVIKDAHHYFDNSRVVGLLKDITHQILTGLPATVVLVSSISPSIPRELEHHVTVLKMDSLTSGEIKEIIQVFADQNHLNVTKMLLEEMSRAFKGLTEYEIQNILSLAYASSGELTKADLKLIHEQKKQVVEKSAILEMIESEEDFETIGGLDNLKMWLKKKAAVFRNLDRASDFGVDLPKGVLITGVPGCGKSLNAKAAAKLLGVPLLRLDMGRVLGKYVGESEANMRKAIALADALSPCVLWIDELEKAFAGIRQGGGGAEVTTRLFGNFLTWMQEKKSATFVVATANDILSLPPELMRKGRFDEIFYVGLPNDEERKQIFKIHIEKRRKQDLSSINLDELVQKTKGYSGADIEGVVKDSVEAAFAAGKSSLATQDIIEAINHTHSLSEIMKEPLEKLAKEYQTRKFKNASI